MTRPAHLLLTTLAAASLCLAGTATAQTGQTATPKQATADTKSPRATLARTDRDFLEKVAHAGHAEVEASKLAQTKATNDDVKTFAKQMIDDHTKSGDELKQLAEAKGVKLPTEPALVQKAQLKVLSVRDGADFDKDYTEDFGIKAHRDTVQLFQKAAQEAQDADVKAFAQKMLPTLQRHLQMAQSLHTQQSAKGPGKPGVVSGSGTGSKP